MTVFALMTTKDEADRYLHCALTHLARWVDGIVVFDDQSDDGTIDISRQFTPWVATRHPGTPPFLEHEGLFRSAAWETLATLANPTEGDWVLSIDADELLAVSAANWTSILTTAATAGAVTVSMPIPEVFQLDPPFIRTDGWWDRGRDNRLIAWQPDGFIPACTCPDEGCRRRRFLDRPMACGHTPGYAHYQSSLLVDVDEAAVVHLGYADPADRMIKYHRYRDRTGHNAAHIESILTAPTLRRWDGPELDIWTGTR